MVVVWHDRTRPSWMVLTRSVGYTFHVYASQGQILQDTSSECFGYWLTPRLTLGLCRPTECMRAGCSKYVTIEARSLHTTLL